MAKHVSNDTVREKIDNTSTYAISVHELFLLPLKVLKSPIKDEICSKLSPVYRK